MPDKIKVETVGPPLDGVEVKIAEDGEILVRGALVMKGYWNEPEATAKALADGWLHTGDVGEIDRDGYILITDRKKDFIKNSGGDMIAPARIEGALTLEPQIAQAMVYGDRRPYLVAVIVPAQDVLDRAKGDEAALQKTIGAVVGAGQSGPRQYRARAALHRRARGFHHRQRADDADTQDPPPRDPQGLRRGARSALRESELDLVVVAIPPTKRGRPSASAVFGTKPKSRVVAVISA